MKSPTSLEEFKKGTWKKESIGGFAKQKDFEKYKTEFDKASESKKEKIAEAHGFTYKSKSTTKKNGKQPKFERTETPEIPERGDDPEYEGPAYQDWRGVDFSPPGMEFREVPDSEKIGNIMAEYYNTKNPLYRQMSEAIVRKFGTRMGTQVQENMILSIGNMVREMAAADQKIYSENRVLFNKGYLQLRTARLNAAAGEAAAHVAGNYQITATKINDITNQWKAQLASDTQRYGIDVTADVQTYMTDVDKILKGATLLSKIKDNPQAASFLYNMVFGDTEINLEDWAVYWDEKYGDIKDTGDTEIADTGATSSADVQASIRTRIKNGSCEEAQNLARSSLQMEYYNQIVRDTGKCSIISETLATV
jgi:hypothetical protein